MEAKEYDDQHFNHRQTQTVKANRTCYSPILAVNFFITAGQFVQRFYRNLQCQRNSNVEQSDEDLELDVIALTYAGAQPQTMMVKAPDTRVADIAMKGPWRPKNVATLAELYRMGQHGC